MMVGNGATDYMHDVWPAYIPTLYGFNMITKELHDDIIDNNCTRYFRQVIDGNETQFCHDRWSTALELSN